MILPQVYEPLFHLYVLHNEASDEQYWARIQRFNRQDDVTLMSYLGVNSKFWFLSDGGKLDSAESVRTIVSTIASFLRCFKIL